MNFKKSVVFKTPRYCRVCRRKVYQGKTMNGYDKYLNFVCDECFSRYFSYTAKLEESDIAVGLRPADIRADEYRVHYVMIPQILRDMAVWLVLSFLTFCVTGYADITFYSGFIGCPMPVGVISSLMAAISFIMFLKTTGNLILGIFKGMNHIRRILLFLESAEFLAVGIFAVNYIVRR